MSKFTTKTTLRVLDIGVDRLRELVKSGELTQLGTRHQWLYDTKQVYALERKYKNIIRKGKRI